MKVTGFKYDHEMYCHCSDYKKDICPEECFRARITEEVKAFQYPYPVSYGNLRSSGYCPLEEISEAENAGEE